jgi:hypothetical protein
MRKSGTGGQLWPLSSPLSNPTWAPDGEIRFDMNDVPDRCPTGPLAYFVPALILTLMFNLVNAGESVASIAMLDLPGVLIKSVEVRDVWHGVPISSQYWLGEHLRIHEFLGNGYEFGSRIPGIVTPSAGGLPVVLPVKIPLSAGEGELMRETSQLALLYQPGSINVTFKPASALDTVSDGTTVSNASARCSLELDPRAELVLGTAVEHVLHRTVAAPSDPDIQIKGFGRSSKLTGVLPKGGVLSLMELTAVVPASGAGLGGVFLGSEVNAYSFDWRGQKITKDVTAVLDSLIGQMGHWPDIPFGANDDSSERTTFPYTSLGATSTPNAPLNNGLMAWLMVLAGMRARLTDLQTADSDQSYHLDLGANTFDTGDHLILARYAKVWAQGKRDDFEAKVKVGGANSLAAYVLGENYASARLRPRAPVDKHTLTADQTAFLPFQLI